jgi:GNAT superfamily N-acetyltransferase
MMRSKSRLFVHHITVAAAYRRRGVAALLFEHLRGVARSGGHGEISLDTWATNADGQAFFAAQGLEVFRYSMRARVT